jgi:site-specific DNA recombinase
MMRNKRDQRSGVTRCAIYTRKSTEEGLEQEFNSLDAQREACAAYILSQRHEGWELLPDLYDDGGYSGGSMNRPGLQQLLADVHAGKVDVIVVYKVDRLTRSLADFAKIVEVLDGAGASFVSVTQAFNTTTSMGRLTLNVLLSFAQFEREVTGERIRDKIAASKKKGMWMGGPVPLGYEVRERKLLIVPAEAATVRRIFSRYVELGSTTQLCDELHREGVRTKLRPFGDGRSIGRVPFTRGALTHLLKNRIYIGDICHRGEAFAGQHEAIVDETIWTEVQRLLGANRRERRVGGKAVCSSLLAGMATDAFGRPLSPHHAAKGSVRYRYYASRREAGDERPAWRVPAGDLEVAVLRLTAHAIGTAAQGLMLDAQMLSLVHQRVTALASRLSALPVAEQRAALLAIGTTIMVGEGSLSVELDREQVIRMAMGEDASLVADSLQQQPALMVSSPVALKRRGREGKLVMPLGNNPSSSPDPKLLELLARAYTARDRLLDQSDGVAASQRPHLTRLARLTYLAPDVIQGILDGRHPVELTPRRLLREAQLATEWEQQRRQLGYR